MATNETNKFFFMEGNSPTSQISKNFQEHPEVFKNIFFIEHLWWLLLQLYHNMILKIQYYNNGQTVSNHVYLLDDRQEHNLDLAFIISYIIANI